MATLTKTITVARNNSRYLLLFLLSALLAACNNNKVYDEFVHAPIKGWEKNDSLAFSIPSLEETGNYGLQLQMRTDNSFPFMSVVLIIDQKVIPGDTIYSDTLNCHVTDERGHTKGSGINIYQHEFSISNRHLNKGDSLYITVRHDMKREMLPGISDIGLVLSKE